jgi:hypothetical protein
MRFFCKILLVSMSVLGDVFNYLKGTHNTILEVDRKWLRFSVVFLYDFASFFMSVPGDAFNY